MNGTLLLLLLELVESLRRLLLDLFENLGANVGATGLMSEDFIAVHLLCGEVISE